ncbi:MAG: LysR family transcriptional regulator, partial [Sphingopyxis sp.]|nr:LysR family transcriptional regulator [Sphingopyxis sp.]
MDNRFGDIETFLAVASGGSFAAGAKALRLTPSAVSRSIARLEERLGTILFRRTTRSLALTAEGTAYRDRMSVLLAEIETVENGLGRDKQGPRGLLRINASPSIGVPLRPTLPRFLSPYSEILLDLAPARA